MRPEHQNTFVLKTYRGPDAKQQHEAEKAAFAKLRSDTNPSPYVIAYHGSFVDEGTENIILEYADQGSFEEFMMRTPKPSTSRDMLEFWDRFSYITHGLASIHGTERSTLTGIPMLLGYIRTLTVPLSGVSLTTEPDGTKISSLQTSSYSVEAEYRSMIISSKLPT